MTTPRIEEMRTPEQNKRVNILMGKLWDVYTCTDEEKGTKINRVWDLLIDFEEAISQAGIDEAVEIIKGIETIKGTDRHRKPADTGLLRKSDVINVIKSI